MLNVARKSVGIIVRRLRTQGVRTTLIWAYARGIPRITGVPNLRFSQVTPEIYVGPQHRRAGKRMLERLVIRYDVNMRIEFDDAIQGLALENYCYLPTVDDDAPTLEHLNQGVDFINRAIAQGGKVYIHCGGGVGRAPTMAAAYFISRGSALDQAIELIRKARPFIRIMPVQMEQLKRFETTQVERGQSS